MNSWRKKYRNRVLAFLITTLLIVKLYLSYINFPTSSFNFLTNVAIFIVSIIILLIFKVKWYYKIFSIVLYIIISTSLSDLNVWKITARNYISQREQFLDPVVKNMNELNQCNLKIFSNNNLKFRDPCDTILINWNSIHELKTNSDILEIDVNQEMVLFTFSRFIDNGYGIAWINDKSYQNILKKNYRMNGLQITSIVLIYKQWYYISFT